MKKIKNLFAIFILLFTVIGCADDKEVVVGITDHVKWHKVKAAVVLPMNDGLDQHWKRTLNMMSENMCQAFSHQQEGVKLEYEWYDESSVDADSLAQALAEREDIEAVIGGLYSSTTVKMAPILSKAKKTFFTLGTAESLVRSHAAHGYLWAMTETDITQCEVLLSKAAFYGAKSVALLVNGEDNYGETFINWFAFQAKEMDLEVKGIYEYNEYNLRQTCDEAMASEADYLICVPSEIQDISPMLNAQETRWDLGEHAPSLLFGDTAYGADVIDEVGPLSERIEGITYGANPESGFEISYNIYFRENSTLGEAQAYDAAMLLGYASWFRILHPEVDLREALRTVVSGRDPSMGSWMAEDIQFVIDGLEQGKMPDINGASSSLNFDAKVYTNVLSTTYYNFKVYNGKYIILDYNTSDGGKRTDATLANWNWKKSQTQQLDENQKDLFYPSLKDKWALLVAGSYKWKNYRHQADVLAIYQLLKSRGYDDDHIVLIMEDDIANNTRNPNPGVVQVAIGGENMYQDIHIDYHLTDLHPRDISDILQGNKSDRLPHVISSTDHDNVLVFWSGHGQPGGLVWGEDGLFTQSLAQLTFRQLSNKKCYRKMLWLVETCYSGSVMQSAEGFPGILAITAANENETSKADIFNEDLGIWMTNRFTYTLRDEITLNSDISLQRLYYKLFINTVGSHVTLYNHENYGNVFTNTMEEYLD